MIYLFKFDSTHGPYPQPLELAEENIVINNEIRIATKHIKHPNKIPWKDMEVTYVIETTGVFTDIQEASRHIDGGAKKVIITAPGNVPMLVFGVNHTCYNPEKDKVVSATSSTTNCTAPIVKLMHENFEVLEVAVTTIHAATAKGNVVDGPTCGKKFTTLWRNYRGCSQNIIPAMCSANISLDKIIPELKCKFSSIQFRVPISNVSLCDMTFRVNTSVGYLDVKKVMREASENRMKDVLGYSEEDCVSSDFNHTTYSCIFDAKASFKHDNSFIKIIAWYDNEYGFASRIVDLLQYMYNADSGNVPVTAETIEHGDD
ncbi:Glyceraldehyde-3-phosphate dehydrogenase [Ooceraea biroi]|uniref:glyceraldehyde-3-phosphate dehydrogenase (NADP(+)) (phosphorylating) n=2 Tax=Ooceraea biroi TaxID=2015173 RepID=A0A026X1P0_OOCBI|nr:Glyceraldehyde-3-phosphate dehydrogenase [Ooceraea biroi]